MTKNTLENLIAQIHGGYQPTYLLFWGHQHDANKPPGKSCFSQWFNSPFVVAGITYATAEHYMMAAKARLFNDTATLEKIDLSTDPAVAKKWGRQVNGYIDEVWSEHRFQVVVDANFAKFSQHTNLASFLLSTGDHVLVEASPVDSVWGVGMVQNDPDILDPCKWKGLNLLGFALMEVRDRLRQNVSQV